MTNQSNITLVTPNELADNLEILLKARIPVMIWGAPGIGKSQIIAQVAKKTGRALLDIRAVQFDPVDLRGIPFEHARKTCWAIPDFLPQVERDGESGILFLDEIVSAPQAIAAALFQLILDRKLGEYHLPTGWDIVAAGNRETDRGVVTRMPTPLANRFAHFELTTDTNQWLDWAATASIDPVLLAFIRFRPDLLHQFDPTSGDKAFPTPRSWEMLSRAFSLKHKAALTLYSSIVGQAAAIELTGFVSILQTIPDPKLILHNPEAAPVPDEVSTRYALIALFQRIANAENIDNLWVYLQRMDTESQVMFFHHLELTKSDLVNTAAYSEYAAKNAANLI